MVPILWRIGNLNFTHLRSLQRQKTLCTSAMAAEVDEGAKVHESQDFKANTYRVPK